jgi:hypothetical protein
MQSFNVRTWLLPSPAYMVTNQCCIVHSKYAPIPSAGTGKLVMFNRYQTGLLIALWLTWTDETNRAIQGIPDGAVICGKMWETKVHQFFGSITQPTTFHISCLNDCLSHFDIEFSSSTLHKNFGLDQDFKGQLASFVKNGMLC